MGLFTTTADKTRYKKLKEEGCVITFSCEVPAAELSEAEQNALVSLQQRARLPGFRPGKAPLDLIKKQFAGAAREEAVERLLRKHVPEGLKELELRPIATPSIEDVKLAEGKPLQFEVRVEVAPKVTPTGYAKLALTKKSYPAEDSAVEARLNELREGHARLDKAAEDVVGKTHYVVIDFQGVKDGKPLPKVKGENELVDMSSDQTVEGLTAALAGMKRAETKEVSVKLEDKPVSLQVTVKEIKTKVLPEVDAEFAKDLGFEGVDALKAKLKEILEAEGEQKSEREVAEQVEQGLLKANKFELPPALVDAQIEHMMQRLRRQLLGGRGDFDEKQREDLRGKLRERAEEECRLSLLLPAIAEKEKIEVSADEIKAELDKSLEQAEDDRTRDAIRKTFADRKDEIVSMLRDRKVMAFIREKATVKKG